MHTPYITSYPDAFAVAQTSVAAVLTAVVWRSPMRLGIARAPLLAAIWLAAIAPLEGAFLNGVGVAVAPDHVSLALTLSRLLAVLALALAPPRWVALLTALGATLLWKIGGYLQESDFELSVAHVAFFASMHAVHVRFASSRPRVTWPPRPPRPRVLHDLLLFVVATFAAAIVSVVVLERYSNSGDEWAYTYQADLFAHFKAYGEVPPCPSLFQNYWVFFHLGRAFAQYTPGWPLLMAPFQRVGLVWLAAPFAFGMMCVAIARLARRAAAADPLADERQIAWAGTIAGACAMLPAGVLLNAGSRYPHFAVAACLAWTIECACATTDDRASKRAQWLWGAGLGLSSAFLLAIRHGDGAALGVGVFLVFGYWLARRREAWRAVVSGAIAFTAIGGLSLVILRLQLGEWFKTGYSIADNYFAFAKVTFSMPKPNEFKYGIPLGTGAYMWWPCAPALGLAGFALARGRGLAIGAMLTIGAIASTALYTALEFGRGYDSGYGPRYNLPTIVAMAVGGGLLLAPLARDAARLVGPSLRRAGPAVLAAAALVSGVARIGVLVFPEAHAEAHLHTGVVRAIAAAKLDHAVVTVQGSEVGYDPLDLTQNLPSDKDPKVLILLRHWGPDAECGRKHFGDRQWYRAIGQTADVRLQPD